MGLKLYTASGLPATHSTSRTWTTFNLVEEKRRKQTRGKFSVFASVNIFSICSQLKHWQTAANTFRTSNPIIIFKFPLNSFLLSLILKCLSLAFCASEMSTWTFPLFFPSHRRLLIDKHCDLETINFEGFRVGFNSFFFLLPFYPVAKGHNLWVIRHVNLLRAGTHGGWMGKCWLECGVQQFVVFSLPFRAWIANRFTIILVHGKRVVVCLFLSILPQLRFSFITSSGYFFFLHRARLFNFHDHHCSRAKNLKSRVIKNSRSYRKKNSFPSKCYYQALSKGASSDRSALAIEHFYELPFVRSEIKFPRV